VSVDKHPSGRRTAWFGGHGTSWTRREAPIPEPGPDELLVRTEAAALNNADAELADDGDEFLAGLTAGDSVLITGATSSVGLVGVHVAKALGAARVVATTRSAGKRDLLVRGGADLVVVTENDDDLVDALRDAPVQVVLDHVGAQTFAACAGVTARGGTVVNVGRLAGAVTELDLTSLAAADVALRAVSYGFADPDQIGRVLAAAAEALLPHVVDGRVRPVIDRVYDFDEASDALDRLRSGDATGNIVLSAPSRRSAN
jgi:NADPH2:quinone reductase